MLPAFCFLSVLYPIVLNGHGITYYPGNQPWHLTGQVYESTGWYVTVENKANTFLTYGPYTNQSNNGNKLCGPNHQLSVSFTLQIDNNDNDNTQVLTLDVNDEENLVVLNTVDIYRTDFKSAQSPQQFELSFTNPNCSKLLEFRVFYVCCSKIIHFKTTFTLSSDNKSNPC